MIEQGQARSQVAGERAASGSGKNNLHANRIRREMSNGIKEKRKSTGVIG